ncbi:MAG TPA: hypothetical protein VFW44_12780 [Bryobacteraceae bacterium]|nr:hypothetical protein [Bryobacteraceae bacterium]
MIFQNKLRIASFFVLAFALSAGQPPSDRQLPTTDAPEDARLPNGKLQRQEILKADYQKNLEDVRALSKMTEELKTELEKSDYNVLSLGILKKVDDIDRLTKRIRDRLHRN